MLENKNFKIPSEGWEIKESDNFFPIKYKVNPEGDVTEYMEGEYAGEQLFTFTAAKRETEKVGKRMPTDEEFDLLIKTKKDIPNLPLSGHRNTDGTFYYRGNYATLWSSAQSTRHFDRNTDTVYRNAHDAALGFSVRCFKD